MRHSEEEIKERAKDLLWGIILMLVSIWGGAFGCYKLAGTWAAGPCIATAGIVFIVAILLVMSAFTKREPEHSSQRDECHHEEEQE